MHDRYNAVDAYHANARERFNIIRADLAGVELAISIQVEQAECVPEERLVVGHGQADKPHHVVLFRHYPGDICTHRGKGRVHVCFALHIRNRLT